MDLRKLNEHYAEIGAELMDAQPPSDVDECRVAGLRESALEAQRTVTVTVMAMDRLCAADPVLTAAIIAVGFPVHRLFLDGCGCREDLEYRSGLVGCHRRAVYLLLRRRRHYRRRR